MTNAWLALVVGNTRLHWGYFEKEQLQSVWHTAHLSSNQAKEIVAAGFCAPGWEATNSLVGLSAQSVSHLPQSIVSPSQLWIASVVPKQTAIWQTATSGRANITTRSLFPLTNFYSTLGIDRAINLLGAGYRLGWPALVIDAGTALTLTAGVAVECVDPLAPKKVVGEVYGGAILPGLRSQQTALMKKAPTLADAIAPITEQITMAQPTPLPIRWANDTPGAIASGLVYGTTAILLDYLTDWWQQFPDGKAVITGGDGLYLHQRLQQRTPEVASRVQLERNLMFWGMQTYRQIADQQLTE